jgi:hypothetical protein
MKGKSMGNGKQNPKHTKRDYLHVWYEIMYKTSEDHIHRTIASQHNRYHTKKKL